jgi:hypothetical protein
MTTEEMRAACRQAIDDIAADPEKLARLPAAVRDKVAALSDAAPLPWTIERLRTMTRQEFQECVRRGDLPPPDLAAQLVAERLGERAERERRR